MVAGSCQGGCDSYDHPASLSMRASCRTLLRFTRSSWVCQMLPSFSLQVSGLQGGALNFKRRLTPCTVLDPPSSAGAHLGSKLSPCQCWHAGLRNQVTVEVCSLVASKEIVGQRFPYSSNGG
jgi:hypothetical protein